jgi:hypothetical protein
MRISINYVKMSCILCVIAILGAGSAFGQITPTPAALMKGARDSDIRSDLDQRVAADGAGIWIAVWRTGELITSGIDDDAETFSASSTDNGLTWSQPVLLSGNSTAASDVGSVNISTDKSGVWIATWGKLWGSVNGVPSNERDILFARSTDNGATWSDAAYLSGEDTPGDGSDWDLSLTSDHNGNWVAVWMNTTPYSPIPEENLSNQFVSRSSDGGLTWSIPALLNPDGVSAPGFDFGPRISTDGLGTWIVVWESSKALGNPTGDDYVNFIYISKSTDNGTSWSSPEVLSKNDAIHRISVPEISTDGNGVWIVTWVSDEKLPDENVRSFSGGDLDIFYSRSADNGLNWMPPIFLNTDAITDSRQDELPQITTDGLGNWIAMWHAGDGFDSKIYMALSTDTGLSWSPPFEYSHETPPPHGLRVEGPRIATDGLTNWVVTFGSFETHDVDPGPGISAWQERDMFASTFTLAAPPEIPAASPWALVLKGLAIIFVAGIILRMNVGRDPQ